jgi:Secretion system C-terminal sorting domain
MKKSTFTILGLLSIVIILTSGIKSTTDANGKTGQTTAGCTCHNGTPKGTITLAGIPTTTLKSTQYTFSLTYTPGVSSTFWGLDVKASVGTLAAGTGMKKSGAEITHSSPITTASSTSNTYTGIKWTAPATAGAATFTYACVAANVTNPASGNWQKGSFATSVVLPVELTGFSVKKAADKNVVIAWQTAIEINSDHFEIEKSNDAKNFKTITKVAAAGNGNNKSYSVTDVLENTSATTYYRIKTVDKDGSFGYSNIQSLNTKTTTSLYSVYPNPVKRGQNVNVELNSEKEQNITFVLLNTQGKIVSMKQKAIAQGYNKISLQFGNYLVSGNYFLQAKINNTLLSPVTISVVE